MNNWFNNCNNAGLEKIIGGQELGWTGKEPRAEFWYIRVMISIRHLYEDSG